MKRDRQQEKKRETVFKVPNTEEGRAFIRALRKYKTAGTRIRARGRGPRARPARATDSSVSQFRQDLPTRYAEYFGVYIDRTA